MAPAKRLRGRPVSRTVTLRRARPSCRAPARPAKLPPMMMTSSMVMGSVLWMEGVGLGLARNSVQRYALETGSEQGFGIDEKVAHHCFSRPDMPHSISPGSFSLRFVFKSHAKPSVLQIRPKKTRLCPLLHRAEQYRILVLVDFTPLDDLEIQH